MTSEAKWHYANDGAAVGPVTAAQIREQMAASPGEKLLVWASGMADWTDARSLPELAAPRRSIDRAKLLSRARHELKQFLLIAAYLFICFGALILYKTALLRSVGVEFAPMGFALIKALILAKFIMLLEALKIDERFLRFGTPLAVIFQKAAVFTLFLIILTIVEELVVGHIHGKESREILSEMAGGTLPQALSVGLLMFLIMIPFLAVRQTGLDFWRTPGD
jgi:hypothetical protein